MRRLIAAVLTVIAVSPALAEGKIKDPELAPPAVLVALHARSGTVAPPYAWAWDVAFDVLGGVTMTYCTGYETTGPACSSRSDLLTADQLAALQSLVPTLTSAPENLNPPVGGGARWAEIGKVRLPAYPLPEDQARVTAAFDALAAFIPEGALDDTAQHAKAP